MNKRISMSIRVSEEELDKLSEFIRRTALKEADRIIKQEERSEYTYGKESVR